MLELLWANAFNLLLFWAVWLLAPLLVDVSASVACYIGLRGHPINADEKVELSYYPPVSVVIPVYNSASTLYKCLLSLVKQTYPVQYIQVVCVDNGSKDNSFEVFQTFQEDYPELIATWISLPRPGKSTALNAGIYAVNGAYIMNVDSDSWLSPEAIRQVAYTFEKEPDLMAATGMIKVDKELGNGFGLVDIINYCEVIEYLIAFNVGRRYQHLKNTLFTLSGAFSVFRREVLLQTYLYQERTVSEDTDLTFQMRKLGKKKNHRVGSILGAVAFVEPVPSFSSLYAQRARWQRGEIENIAINYEKAPGIIYMFKDFIGRMFVSDHTLAFTRMTWKFLIFFLYFLGYQLSTILFSIILLYICYLGLDLFSFYLAYKEVHDDYQSELKKIWWIALLLPIFRFLIFWFRMGGIILAVTETKTWRVENPVSQLRSVLAGYSRITTVLPYYKERYRKL